MMAAPALLASGRSPAHPGGPAVLRRCACGGRAPEGGECEACRKKRLGVQRSASSAAAPGFAPPLVHEVLRSPGRPLDGATRAFMEPRFGHSFADVRIHADTRAAESAAAVQAHAYAVGRDVVFGAGKYAPASAEGRRLLAHELAHVVQQTGEGRATAMASLEVGPADAPEERRAEAAAERVMAGAAAALDASAGVRVARAPGGDSTEEMHHALAEQWRREHGLPPGGVDEEGRQVGPTDGEIVHGAQTLDTRPACPAPDDEKALLCLGVDQSPDQLTCRLTIEHERILSELRRQALAQVQGATRRLGAASAEARRLIEAQADLSFARKPPPWDRIRTVVGAMESILGGTTLRFEGAACGDHACYSPILAAYVDKPGQMPLYVCMHSFNPKLRPQLMKTIIHEVAHLAGVATDTPAGEDYCENAACDQECRGPEHADAWLHFIDCIGGAMLTPPENFDDRIIQDVEGL